MQPFINETVRSISTFAVIAPGVFENDSPRPIEIHGTREVDSVNVNVARIFRRVERNVHRFIVYAINRATEAGILVRLCKKTPATRIVGAVSSIESPEFQVFDAWEVLDRAGHGCTTL